MTYSGIHMGPHARQRHNNINLLISLLRYFKDIFLSSSEKIEPLPQVGLHTKLCILLLVLNRISKQKIEKKHSSPSFSHQILNIITCNRWKIRKIWMGSLWETFNDPIKKFLNCKYLVENQVFKWVKFLPGVKNAFFINKN